MSNQPFEKLWALLSVDRNGNEGLCLLDTPFGPQLAVTGSEKNLTMMKELSGTMDARKEAHDAGMKIVVAEYKRELVTPV